MLQNIEFGLQWKDYKQDWLEESERKKIVSVQAEMEMVGIQP